jgi:hypothetical protein
VTLPALVISGVSTTTLRPTALPIFPDVLVLVVARTHVFGEASTQEPVVLQVLANACVLLETARP